jgi:transposase
MPMLAAQLLLPLDAVALDHVELHDEHAIVHAHSTQQVADCPVCHTPSMRPHSWYTRTLADAPGGNRIVTLLVRVRRFFCDVPHCPRKIFAERWAPAVLPYARRTTRLTEMLRAVAFATGGHSGARLAHTLRMPTSIRTLLRLMHQHEVPPVPAPRAVGIDDWAWKKGCTYGTLVVDLERHHPIDLLPDRTTHAVTAWLAARPTIEIIARDRSGSYAEAATAGAPQATQVADRWHLLVRRFTRRLILVTDEKGSKDCLWVNQLTLRRKPRGTRACW